MEVIESFFDHLDSRPFLIISVLLKIVGLWLILSLTIDQKSFMGRYKNRHGKDYWKIWVGTKK